MSRRALLLIGGHLANAPRPLKEARALRDAGFDVAIRGVWSDEGLSREDLSLASAVGAEMRAVVDLTHHTVRGTVARLRARFARELVARFGIASPRAYGVGATELLHEALVCPADIVIGHSEAALWVCDRLIGRGRRVAFDFEDWFSEDLLPSDRAGRPVAGLAALERRILRAASFCATTTSALAGALESFSACGRRPSVVPNCFPYSEVEGARGGCGDDRDPAAVSFYWYSQTIGPGRGLEALSVALRRLRGNWQVLLRGGTGVHQGWIAKTFDGFDRRQVRFVDPVPNSELLSRALSHDVGLALEVPYCRSRDLTATNKLFEYMRAGLAVIATATTGQKEVLRDNQAIGIEVEPGNVAALTDAMQVLIDHPERLRRCRASASEAARNRWDWARFAPQHASHILHAVERGEE